MTTITDTYCAAVGFIIEIQTFDNVIYSYLHPYTVLGQNPCRFESIVIVLGIPKHWICIIEWSAFYREDRKYIKKLEKMYWIAVTYNIFEIFQCIYASLLTG